VWPEFRQSRMRGLRPHRHRSTRGRAMSMSTVQRQTSGLRSITPQSPHFITLRVGTLPTEAQQHRRLSQRQETAGIRRSSIGCYNTRNLRRMISTCGFLLSDYNRSDSCSVSYRSPTILNPLSGFENKSTQQDELMSQYYHDSKNHTTADESTTNQCQALTECPACDSPRTTVKVDMWHCGRCGASGFLSGGDW
jgi:hypothetical protein